MSNQVEQVKLWTAEIMRLHPDMPSTVVETILMRYLEDPLQFEKDSSEITDALAQKGFTVKQERGGRVTEINTMTITKPGSKEYDLLLTKFQAPNDVEPTGESTA